MVDVFGEPVPNKVIIESIQAQSKLEAKQSEMEELDRIQSVVQHGAKLFSTNTATRQEKVEVALIPDDLDPMEKEAPEEAWSSLSLRVFSMSLRTTLLRQILVLNFLDQGQCLKLMQDKLMFFFLMLWMKITSNILNLSMDHLHLILSQMYKMTWKQGRCYNLLKNLSD